MFLVICIVGILRLEDGLDLTEVVPKDSTEHSFIEAQSEFFGNYDFFAVTKVCLTFFYTCNVSLRFTKDF